MSDDGDGPTLVEGETAHQGGVVGIAPVAVYLHPFREQGLNVIESVGPVRMAGHERLLPGGEPREHETPFGLEPLAEAARLALLRGVPGEGGELVDLLLQGEERRFEVRIRQVVRSS